MNDYFNLNRRTPGRSNLFWAGLAGWVTLLLISCPVGAAPVVTYRNPVIPGDHPDPSIIRVGKDYWATSTSGNWGPEFPLLHSRDLVNWTLEGNVLAQPPAWAAADFWAPEISEFKGRFHVYYVARKKGGPLSVAVATADRPGGPYTDQGPLISQPDGSIDPVPVWDENGKPYIVWKEDGNSAGRPTPIWAQPLDDRGTKVTGQPVELIRNDVDWEGGVVEGAYILRNGGWFYLFYSGNGCCGPGCNYALGVARSRRLLGPWEKNRANPILFANGVWKCPGHGSIVTDPQGRYWLLYHAYAAADGFALGREAMLDEVTFDTNGWAVINGAQGPTVEGASPFGAAQKVAEANFADSFSGEELNPGWRWPLAHEPKYLLEHGKLTLSAMGRDTNLAAAFVAQPVTGSNFIATAVIDLAALKSGSAAGIGTFDEGHSEGVAVQNGKLVVWREIRGSRAAKIQPMGLTGDVLHLKMTVRNGRTQFATSPDGAAWTPVNDEFAGTPWPAINRGGWVTLTVGGAPGAEARFDSFSMEAVKN
jgi:beta-xylosidase